MLVHSSIKPAFAFIFLFEGGADAGDGFGKCEALLVAGVAVAKRDGIFQILVFLP